MAPIPRSPSASVQNLGAGQTPAYPLNSNITTWPAQQYTQVVGQWDDVSATIPVNFLPVGTPRLTQYNIPNESSCSANRQTVYVYFRMDTQYCYWTTAFLGTQFVNAVTSTTKGTGTGIAQINGATQILKSYSAGARNYCPLPSPYTGLPTPATTNTFFAMDTGGHPIPFITGTNNTQLSDGTSVPSPLSQTNQPAGSVAAPTVRNSIPPVPPAIDTPFSFGDGLLLVGANGITDPLGPRSVQDLCPACAKTTLPTVNGIDVYSSNPSCSGVGDYVTGGTPITSVRIR